MKKYSKKGYLEKKKKLEEEEKRKELEERRRKRKEGEENLEKIMGFEIQKGGFKKIGWLINFHTTTLTSEDGSTVSGLDMYFIDQYCQYFKACVEYEPYFYVEANQEFVSEVGEYLGSRFKDEISQINIVPRKDLSVPNHLNSSDPLFLQLKFRNIGDLLAVRKFLLQIVRKNKQTKSQSVQFSSDIEELLCWSDDEDEMDDDDEEVFSHTMTKKTSQLGNIIQILEYDIKYHVRVSIDLDIRCGNWYEVVVESGETMITCLKDEQYLERAQPKICAFDIETTKAPLLFPDAKRDQIMLLSYMVDNQGYLIVNREIMQEDVDNFEYTPKPEYPGKFIVWNVSDEKELLLRFCKHMKEEKPLIYVTYNGDNFDFPFMEERANQFNFSLRSEIGLYEEKYGATGTIFKSHYAIHLDAFYWVKRDSYLPVGSQGLKKVTKSKLGYDPIEIDYEQIVPMAQSNPQRLAQYSVSDAVATYYLYTTFVHPFIFSLCTLIPMGPDDVLRKGTGTLCEALLLAKAFDKNIIAPNPKRMEGETYFKNHLVESETYIGGHVESLKSGIFRCDHQQKFELDPTVFDELSDDVEEMMKFHFEKEAQLPSIDEVKNFNEVVEQIKEKLKELKEEPKRIELPKIYHLDVGAMYPNIILTNRLQPCSVVTDEQCLSCSFNNKRNNCKRKMKWTRKINYFTADKREYLKVKNRTINETYNFRDLPEKEQKKKIRTNFSKFCQKQYKTIYKAQIQKRKSTVCMRENPFYVETIRNFRNRRMDYKRKLWKARKDYKEAQELSDEEAIDNNKSKVILFDSLQIAHKCILNSFYGYVMRKGARWYSMEMAGIVTNTGKKIIKMARKLAERIGIPLELDTDGIWTLLPESFPENFKYTISDGSVKKFSYPCVMLNFYTYKNFTNHQYQRKQKNSALSELNETYNTKSICEIFFEVDGPYRAMILPSSLEEGKGIKKRYAVYNMNGGLAELKGFEIKRRGELKLIKILQGHIFEKCLSGKTLEDAYRALAREADHFLNILLNRGAGVDSDTLLMYLTETSNMSKKLEEYGKDQKSNRITTAKRLMELHGEDYSNTTGLACSYIISKLPDDAPVSERAIPVSVFLKNEGERVKFLKKWTKDYTISEKNTNIHSILDWNYYLSRLTNTLQRIITIPAVLQGLPNPISRVKNPDWVSKLFRQKNVSKKAKKMDIKKMFMSQHVKNSQYPTQKKVIGESPLRKRKYKYSRKNLRPYDSKEIISEESKSKVEDVMVQFKKEQCITNEITENENYNLFRRVLKMKWIQNLQIKKRRKLGKKLNKDEQEQLLSHKGESISSGSYLLRSEERHKHSNWRILQISVVESLHDTFRVFYILKNNEDSSNHVHSKLLTLKREVYFDCDKELDLDSLESLGNINKTSKILPHGKPSRNLYKFECDHVDISELVKGYKNEFGSNSTIYEQYVNPLFNAIVSMGDECKLKVGSRMKITNKEKLGYKDFEKVEKTNEVPKFSKIIVFAIFNQTNGVFCMAVEPLGEINVYATRCKLDRIDFPSDSLYDIESQKITYFDTLEEIQQEVERKLSGIMRRMALLDDPSIIIYNNECLKKSVKNYASLHLSMETEYEIVPTLNWSAYALGILEKYLNSYSIIFRKLCKLSNSYDIPICNMNTHHPYLSALDVMYARELRRNNHLLWAGQQDELEWNKIFRNKARYTFVCNPGIYGSRCYEIELGGLAKHSLQTASLNFSDKSEQLLNLSLKKLGEEDSENEVVVLGKTIKVLQKLSQFLGNETEEHFEYVDLLDMFEKWILRPSPLNSLSLHDQAMANLVHRFMKTKWVELLSQIEKYGSKVVFADFSKIIICPNTNSSEFSHEEYIQNILNALLKRNKTGFELEVTKVYNRLMFVDDHNYTGLEKNNTVSSYYHMNYQWDKPLKKLFCRSLEHIIRSGKCDLDKKLFEEICYKSKGNDEIGRFVTQICHVLIMDIRGEFELEKDKVYEWKKNCFRGLNVFGENFRSAKTGYVVMNVSCGGYFCNRNHTFDLLRNEKLLKNPNEWKCESCDEELDQSEIEERIIRRLKMKALEFQNQELKCQKCGEIPKLFWKANCECSSDYTYSVSMQKMDKLLSQLKEVASIYSMKKLSENVKLYETIIFQK